MASTCMSTCIADDARIPVRATYVNLYKWPESDREFVRSVSNNGRRTETGKITGHPRVVDSISCRQLYLRSYTFSRKESMNERTKKCIGRVREKVSVHGRNKKPPTTGGGGERRRRRRKCSVVTKMKVASCAALGSIFRRLLYCTTKVDVVG